MKADIVKVKASPNVFIPVDKTTNMYELFHQQSTKNY